MPGYCRKYFIYPTPTLGYGLKMSEMQCETLAGIRSSLKTRMYNRTLKLIFRSEFYVIFYNVIVTTTGNFAQMVTNIGLPCISFPREINTTSPCNFRTKKYHKLEVLKAGIRDLRPRTNRDWLLLC